MLCWLYVSVLFFYVQVFDLKILSALALSQRVSREKIWEELGKYVADHGACVTSFPGRFFLDCGYVKTLLFYSYIRKNSPGTRFVCTVLCLLAVACFYFSPIVYGVAH